MKYRQTFGSRNLVIRFSTDDREILELVRLQLDRQDVRCGRARLCVRLDVRRRPIRGYEDSGAFWYREEPRPRAASVSSYGVQTAVVTIDPLRRRILSVVRDFDPRFKERLYDFIVTRPLTRLLAIERFYFVHASSVIRRGRCVLISGPQHGGKTAAALALVADGGGLLFDDDCFVRIERGVPRVYGLPTRMGLKPSHERIVPGLICRPRARHLFGGKFRLSPRGLFGLEGSVDAACRTILFPRYRPSIRALSLVRLTAEEATRRMVSSGFRPYPPHMRRAAAEHFFAYRRTAAKAGCYELRYNDATIGGLGAALDRLGP